MLIKENGVYRFSNKNTSYYDFPTQMNGLNVCDYTNLTDDQYYLELIFSYELNRWCMNPTSLNNSGKWICKRSNYLLVSIFYEKSKAVHALIFILTKVVNTFKLKCLNQFQLKHFMFSNAK
jgi:hypothetical protein